MRTKQLIIAILLTSLFGCTTKKIVLAPGSDIAAIELAEASVAVSNSLNAIAAKEQVSSVKIKEKAIDSHSIEMGKLASVNWNGPLEPLVRKIAQATRYRVKVLGLQPAMPVLVSVNVKEEYLGDILRQASLQAKNHVQLLVYPEDKLIELHYLN